MSDRNSLGEKAAQPKISKASTSLMKRERRMASLPRNKKYCGKCGFRVRGKNHCEGSHHATRLTAK